MDLHLSPGVYELLRAKSAALVLSRMDVIFRSIGPAYGEKYDGIRMIRG